MSKNSKEKGEEKVMVVRREDLFADGIWNGIKTENLKKHVNLISKKHTFLKREIAEHDPNWKQVIPYMIFENNGQIFLMKRKSNHSDLRLANLFSIGIGGHINKSDIRSKSIVNWAKREFSEEVEYAGKYKTEFLGLINDDSNDVGMVHVGLVIKLTGNNNGIKIRDEHKSGEMTNLSNLGKHYKQMETWSQIIYDFVSQEKKEESEMKKNGTYSGILPDWMIADAIKKGQIKIFPLNGDWQNSIDQVSMDFHLGGNIKLFRGGTYRFIDTRRGLPADAMEEINLKDDDPFILEPGAFAIASTKEILRLPSDILGRLEGKSSLARLGILVHSTAARFDPGWDGAPVLELGNLGPKPAILYCGMAICAFTFERIAAPVKMPYAGSRSDRYSGSSKAVASRVERNANRR